MTLLADFVRHARRFGSECVLETAADCLTADEYDELKAGLALVAAEAAGRAIGSRGRRRRSVPLSERELADIEARRPRAAHKRVGARTRRTTPALCDQVLVLRQRGMRPAAIANTLNIAERRVKTILKREATSQNGGLERLEQAELLVD